MKTNLRFDFLADKANSRIVVEKEFAAPRQRVWDCHTKSELLDRWFAPATLTTKTRHMDFRAGGYWHYAMTTPDGQSFWSRLDYLTIDPIDEYTGLDGFTDETGVVNPAMPRSRLHTTFADVAAGTLVTTVVQYDSSEDVQKVIDMGMKDGIASTVARLDELLAAG